jgi:hypothetical protein
MAALFVALSGFYSKTNINSHHENLYSDNVIRVGCAGFHGLQKIQSSGQFGHC